LQWNFYWIIAFLSFCAHFKEHQEAYAKDWNLKNYYLYVSTTLFTGAILHPDKFNIGDSEGVAGAQAWFLESEG
jgi:hypothetical protein